MCGIAGLVGQADQRYAEFATRNMVAALSRRGPDSEGIEIWPQAVLGHRRLSIFDLSEAGRQPMMSPDRSLAVVFNGAIYNFRALRAELVQCGYQFLSNTDTEVLIHGYREWGIDALVKKLRGMFAIAIWDDATHHLYLVRDRLGVKPLLYAERDGWLAFASTTRALQRAQVVTDIDPLAIAEYLEFGYVTDARTIYRGASKVPAGTIVEWSNGRLQAREYWSQPTINETRPPSFDEAVEETERLFLRAVEMRLFADVPVGSLLSGGVDSSLVCWAIARLGGHITAFTVGTPGHPWDETNDARATADALHIQHRVLDTTPEDAPDVQELVSAYGEPFACASALGMLKVSKAVKNSATVLLTGDGGDDVFLGYPEHRHLWYAERLACMLPKPAASFWYGCRSLVPQVGLLRRASHFLDYTTGGLGAVAATPSGLPVYQRDGLLGERIASATLPHREMPWSLDGGRRVVADFLSYDRRTRFVGEYMTKVDGATMHYALEARAPFLDQDLWEFAATLPLDIRMRGGHLKAILRELARRRIGERVASGRKRGFGIPVQRWLADRWRPAFEAALNDSLLGRQGWIRPAAAQRQLQRASQKGWVPNNLWYIFVLETWLRQEAALTVPDLHCRVTA